jgi:methylenetetrahydrofolate dehydrogenase (NADP+)/methenyltetrahydrofolate cyclohydrolase
MRMLEHYGVEPKGKKVVIVGKSLAVGKPLAMMMLAREATVTVCHRETADLGRETRDADILCTATGRAGSQGGHGEGGRLSWTSASMSCRTA